MPLNRIARSLVVTIAVFLLSPTSPLAQKGTGTLTGFVGDAHGAPLAGAKITLTSGDAKQVTGQSVGASTDGTGEYRFEGLKPGRYTVVFESKGTVAKTQTIHVKAGHTTSLNERLRPPAAPKKDDTY